MSKLLSLITLLAVVALLVAGCGATPEPQVIKETVVVTEEKEVTVVETVEVEKEVTVVETVEVEKEVTVVETVEVEVEKEVMVPVVVDPGKKLDIYMVQHALCAWDAWWCTLKDAVETAEASLGVNVTILGPDEFDLEKTAALIDQAVAAQPDGIAVTVTDPVLFKEPIMRAIEAGIPVVAFNAGSGPEKDGIPYLTYVGMDEYQGGYQGGKKLVAAGGTKAVCVNHQVGHTGLDARCQGLTDAFAEADLEAEVLAVSNDPAESQTIIDDYYTANPDTDTFLTLGPNSANPFYAFMEAAGLGAGDVLHGTFDLSPEIEAAIADGTTLFGIDQQPYMQGFGSVWLLSLVGRLGIMPASPVTPTGPGFVEQSNVGFEAQPDKAVDIYMVQHALCAWDAWWCTLKQAVEDAERHLGVNVTVLGPDEFDLEKTAALIDQAVAAQPDGIALTVTDPVLFKEPIMRAIEAGIPVLAFNAGSGPEKDGIPYMTYIGMDEYQGGYQGGKRLANAGGTKAVCVNHQVGHAGLDARCQGLVDAFTEAGLEAEVLAVTNDPAESQTIIDDYYTANPDIDTFLTMGPNSANPFYAFMEAAGLGAGDVQHGTFDLSAEIVAKIKDGTTLFGIDQQPYLQGYGSVLTLTLLDRYGITPALPVTATGPGFVDLSNITIVEALAGTYR
ncbi:MAG TPA: sugar ABC transporter substrate-binding protein [Anaerolineae bacterium]|nr:sugar ABC transporter substrate-binding protein [Anaerolineae bacterium]